MPKNTPRPRGLSLEESFRWYIPAELPENECWEWPIGKDQDGYGLIQFAKRQMRAHIVSYTIHHGPVPDHMLVLHDPLLCNNASCVNPKHLRVGSNAENMRDRVAAKTHAAGERNGRSRLTEQAVRQIRAQHADGETMAALARDRGVSERTIFGIIYRQTWKHI